MGLFLRAAPNSGGIVLPANAATLVRHWQRRARWLPSWLEALLTLSAVLLAAVLIFGAAIVGALLFDCFIGSAPP